MILGEGTRILPYKTGDIMVKICTKCKAKKDISLFFRNKYKLDGRQSQCKECHNIATKNWRKNNPETYKDYDRKRKRNPKQAKISIMRSRKYREEMTDGYIRNLMTMKSDLDSKDISDELVEIHRLNLKLKRKLELTSKLKPPT